MKRKPLIDDKDEVRELTKADMKKFRPAIEVVPHLVKAHKAGLIQLRGRPPGRTKEVISISLDKDVLSALRFSGAGWQTRVNDLLKAAVGITSKE